MTRKNKAKKKKVQSKASKLINASRSDYAAHLAVFNQLSAKEIYQNFNQIKSSGYFKKGINLTLDNSASDIYYRHTPNASVSKNLSWCIALINNHKDKIIEASKLKGQILTAILRSDFNSAIELLTQFDSIVGISVWSTITKASIIAISKEERDFDPKEAFGDFSRNSFFNYVLFYVNGYFTDDEIYFTSKSTHRNDIHRSANPSVRDFFLYRFFGFEHNDNFDFSVIFNVEKNSSIWDIYHLITSTLEFVTVNQIDFKEAFDYEIKHVVKVLEEIGYQPSRNLNAIYGLKDSFAIDMDSISIVDLYTSGEYEELIAKCLEIGIHELDFSVLELFAKSFVRFPTCLSESFIASIVQHMSNVLQKNESYRNSLEFLSCIANSFRTLEWFKQLGYFVDRESENKSYHYREVADKGIHVLSNIDTPKKGILFNSITILNYLSFLNKSYSKSPSVALSSRNSSIEIDSQAIENIERNRAMKYSAIELKAAQEFVEAENIFKTLISDGDQLTKLESITELTKLYIASNQFDKGLINLVDYSLSNTNIFSIFDTRLLLDSLELKSSQIDLIDLPIAYALHSSYVDSRYESNLKFSFENFLYLNGLEFPTELFGKEEVFGKDKLHFFLRKVCTPEVMKLYLNFETARDIEVCRLQICNYLLDKTIDVEDIQFEIKNINKNLVIRKAVKQVENSRIYVDSLIFKGRLSAPYKSLFDRYLELDKSDDNLGIDDLNFGKLVDILSTSKTSPKEYWKSLSILHIPDTKLSPKNATFLSLAKLMREEFTFGDKGINNYLSTRIRHGVLPTALRKTSKAEGLYFSEKSSLSDCKDSLLKQTNITFEEDDFEHIWKIFSKFTSQLEAEISELNDKRLQIYTLESGAESSDKSEAMFNYSISPLETFGIQKELPLSPSYDDFVKVMMEWLWYKTDYILEQVKNYITTEYRAKLNQLFVELNDKVQSAELSKAAKTSIANAILRAKNGIDLELTQITTWFDHADSEGDDQFDLNTAVEIAKRSLNVLLTIEESNEYKIPQKSISYWVDVFFILFENAISKSELNKGDVEIKIEIKKQEENIVKVSCLNKTKKVPDFKKANELLDFYRQAYGNEELIRDVIQDEGGTGFFKIWKIIQRDLNINHKIDFGYASDDEFIVNLELNTVRGGSIFENTHN